MFLPVRVAPPVACFCSVPLLTFSCSLGHVAIVANCCGTQEQATADYSKLQFLGSRHVFALCCTLPAMMSYGVGVVRASCVLPKDVISGPTTLGPSRLQKLRLVFHECLLKWVYDVLHSLCDT